MFIICLFYSITHENMATPNQNVRSLINRLIFSITALEKVRFIQMRAENLQQSFMLLKRNFWNWCYLLTVYHLHTAVLPPTELCSQTCLSLVVLYSVFLFPVHTGLDHPLQTQIPHQWLSVGKSLVQVSLCVVLPASLQAAWCTPGAVLLWLLVGDEEGWAPGKR